MDEERETGPFGLTARELLELAAETALAEAENGHGPADGWTDALAECGRVWS